MFTWSGRVLGEEHMPEDSGVRSDTYMFLLIPGSISSNMIRDDGLAEILKGLKHNNTLASLKCVDCDCPTAHRNAE